jgi:AraC-like DNA-binding protein
MAGFARLIAEAPDRMLSLVDVCARIGVAERTLRACCHDFLGLGPSRYLMLRRMSLARLALRTGDPAATRVTDIALSYGFAELGRFAVAYKALFGESPSATLRRPPDDRGHARRDADVSPLIHRLSLAAPPFGLQIGTAPPHRPGAPHRGHGSGARPRPPDVIEAGAP